MRILGLDYGQRRIGVAVSDPSETVATPLPAIRWDGRDLGPVVAALLERIAEYGNPEQSLGSRVGRVLVGLPIALNGEEGPAAAGVRRFSETLGRRLGLPVEFQDERLSTRQARTALWDSGLSGTRKKERLDSMAAQILLQRWLDARRPPAPPADA